MAIDLERRLLALPGIGDIKAKALLADPLFAASGSELPGSRTSCWSTPMLAILIGGGLEANEEQSGADKQKLTSEGRSSMPATSARR